MVKVLVATGNPGKLRELEQILAELAIEGIELVSLRDVPAYEEPKETGLTFIANAAIKAHAGATATGLPCVADDSGLTVEAMGGMPGILSARWCGVHGDDEGNNRLLLAQMEDIEQRAAAFVSSCVLATPDGQEYTSEGRWEGELLREPRGQGGFGYDPIFAPADAGGRTSAELSAEEKNALSHRGKALRELAPLIAGLRTAE